MSALKKRRSESVDSRASRRGSCLAERKRPSSEERISRGSGFMNRWSGARKSSINLFDVKRKDVRPLNDKVYQKKKVSELVDFLEELEFKYPITKSKLMSPSKKDFEVIFQFLYNILDQTYEVKKIEEEAPKILKNLGYPFNVNKSAFTYAARTTFPAVLGVLTWMMDLVKFVVKVDAKVLFQNNSDVGGKTGIRRIADNYIYQCYYNRCETEDTIFTDIIKGVMTESIEELAVLHEEKLKLLAAIDKEIKEMDLLEDERQVCDGQLKRYEEWGIKMKDHYEKRNEACELRLAQLHLKESELKKLQDEVAVKEAAYDAQGFDGKKQLQYFESQKKELLDKLEKKQTIFKEIQDKYWDMEIKTSKNVDKMKDVSESFGELYNKTVEEINAILEPLKTMKNPHIKKLCSNYNSNFPLLQVPPPSQSDLWITEQRKVLVNIENVVKSVDEVFKRVTAFQKERLSELQAKNSEISRQLKLLLAKESLEESDLTSKEKQAVDEVKNLESQNEKIRNSIQALQIERLDKEKMYKEIVAELTILETFQEKRDKELKECMKHQMEIFAYCEKKEQDVLETALELQSKTLQKLQEWL